MENQRKIKNRRESEENEENLSNRHRFVKIIEMENQKKDVVQTRIRNASVENY